MMIAFAVLCILILYTYVGYPITVWLIGALRRKTVRKRQFEPMLSVVIPAHNEAPVIRRTVLNKLKSLYPSDKREVIVVSDGSDDGTDEIVESLGIPGLQLIRQEPRQGKTAALNRAVKVAKGEVIVFSDANSLYGEDALRHLAANFADPAVGYVTGKLSYANPDGSGVAEGCGAYMRYENLSRTLETRCGSIVGVNGGIDAMRKDLYVDMSPDMLPDFMLPLSVVERGYRVVYEPKATVAENALSSSRSEFQMRVRVALRALHALWHMRRMFNPFKYGLFSFQLLSHKLLRYSVPFFLIALVVVNTCMITRSTFWQMAFAAQCLFYGSAALGYFLLPLRRRLPSLTYFPLYFVLLNWATLVAWVRFFRKKKQVVWAPRTG